MPAHTPRLAGDPWRDVNGTHISLFCHVERVVEDGEPTVLGSWLHQHGQVVGQGLDSLYVCFLSDRVISVRPQLLRVLDDAPGGGD